MKLIFSLLLISISFFTHSQELSLYDLSVEHRVDPVGIEYQAPRLSWKIKGSAKNILQKAYSIRVATSPDFSTRNRIWESGKIISEESILQSYKGPSLQSGKRYYWQVKIWNSNNKESHWSPVAFWEMGLLNLSDWKAKWIEPTQDTSKVLPAMFVRKDFRLKKNIARARAYVTAHGMYELSINGKKVGDQVLMPGWTSYNKRLQYQAYDITALINKGDNAIGAVIGDGWYRGPIGHKTYGKKLGLLCQLNIEYTDGSIETVTTDDSWKGSANGPVIMNSIYDGETYDARKEFNGWDRARFNDKEWTPVFIANYPFEKLIATETVPIKKTQVIKPIKIFRTEKGTLVADMGQNMVGWIRLKVEGEAGTTVTLRHAEVLDKYGEFYTENLRSAKATMKYTLKGGGAAEVYEPHFTFFGFRYIAVDGFPGELKPENITGIVVHSDMKVIGTFECSNQFINQLQHNIFWSQKGNFIDVPTDCPQRDERVGWTGDAQVFCRTAAFNMNVAAFFTKWLKDLATDQFKNGMVPVIVPNIATGGGSAGWADASSIIPSDLYEVYGDSTILENQFESMKAWVDYVESQSKDGLSYKGFHFGDWLFYKPDDDRQGRTAVTDKYLIAQCFFANSTQLVINAARILGKTEDEKKYAELLAKIKSAFLHQFVTPAGRLISGTQTAYVLALNFDMLPESLRKGAAQRLVDNIKDYGNHLTTGFLGTPYLCHVLTRFGHNDVAYTLLLQETYPSWLYPVKMGATTIWERWDGIKTDSTFQTSSMNSFNHYAYGAIGDWMYRVAAGINIEKPGYKHSRIQPRPDARLRFAKATYESSYGLITSGWELKDSTMTITVKIPPNTRATVVLPKAKTKKIQVNNQAIENQGFQILSDESSDVIVQTGSGDYTFSYPLK